MSKKISQLSSAADVTASDLFQMVDIEDSAMANSGTNKKVTAQLLANELAGIVSNNTMSGAKLVDGTTPSSKLAAITATGSTTARTIENRFADVVNVKDFGAVGNGSDDDTQAIQDAITFAVSEGIGIVFVPSGTYRCTAQIFNNGCIVEGEGDSTVFVLDSGLPSPVTDGNLFVSGQLPSLANAKLLSANVTAGDFSRTITLSSGGGTSFTANSYAILLSNLNSLPGSDVKDAEYVYIESVVGDTITVRTPTILSYSTSNSAKLLPVTLTENVGYKNFRVVMDDSYSLPNPASVNYMFMASGVYARFCKDLIIENVSGSKAVFGFILLIGCVNSRVIGVRASDMYSDTFDKQYATGYGVVERALNLNTLVDNLVAINCRTGYTTVASPTGEFPYGHPTNSLVCNGIHFGSKSTGWDTHGVGINVTFSNLKAVGSRRAGFQVRSYRMNVYDVEASDCGGSAVAIFGGGSSNVAADQVLVRGVRSRNTNTYNGTVVDPNDRDWRTTGAIHVGCNHAVVEAVVVDDCGGPLITEASVTITPEYKNIRGRGIRNLNNGTWAIATGADSSSNPIFEDIFISDSPNVTNVVYRTNFSSLVELRDVVGYDIDGNVFTSVVGEAGVIISGGSGPETYSAVGKNATISSDSISLIGIKTPSINVLPESGTTDSLSTITGAVVGGYVEIWGTAGNAITIVHGTGSDGLYLRGATNAVLGVNQGMAFRRRGGNLWYEIWRTF